MAYLSQFSPVMTHYYYVQVDGLNIFYREAGPQDAPTLLLLHGYPTSSHMFRNLIPRLASQFHVIAPDYPGFGQSSMPDRKRFSYTFENLTTVLEKFLAKIGVDRFTMYVMDYGAPIGFRLALRNPDRIEGLIAQNGIAYEEGFGEFWEPLFKFWKDPTADNRQAISAVTEAKATKWQYENGVKDVSLLDPTAWLVDQVGLDRPGNADIQLDLLYDYRTNVPLYPKFQEFFRRYKPPTLITWGKNDTIFPPSGAKAYLRDIPDAELHLLDTGHFALETHVEEIADKIEKFFGARMKGKKKAG